MFYLALQELNKDFGPTKISHMLNGIICNNNKQFTRTNVNNWLNGHLPKLDIQDAIVFLYIREKGETKIHNLISSYIYKVTSRF